MKKLRALAASFAAFVSILSFAAVPVAFAAAGSDTCLWIGGSGTNWNTSANWSGCSGGVPVSGDIVKFDNNSLSADLITNNDITGLVLAGVQLVTSTGTNAYNVTINGNAFSTSGDITNSATVPASLTLGTDVTITNNVTFAKVTSTGIVAVGSHNLSAANGTSLKGLSGSGNVTVSSSNYTSQVTAPSGQNAGFTGTITVQAGGVLFITPPTSTYGGAKFVIETDGVLNINSTSATVTIPNEMTLAGDTPIAACIANTSGVSCTQSTDGTVTFTGKITLLSDVALAGSYYESGDPAPAHKTTFNIDGEFVDGGFALSAYSGSNSVVVIDGVVVDGGDESDEATDEEEAEAPDTGFGIITANPIQTLAITALLGSAVFFISRRVLAKASVRR